MLAPRPIRWLATFVAASALVSHADALVLDWNTSTWNPTSPNASTLRNEFDLDGTPGTDMTMTLVYSTQNAGSPWRAGLPAIDTTLQGGQAADNKSLHLGVDFTAQAHTITITLDFSHIPQGVEGFSFTLFDIDRADGSAAYIDQIRSISGVGVNGVTAVPPTISGLGSRVSWDAVNGMLTGTGPADNTGAASNAGNATISFSQPIRSFTFVWGVPNSNANNPVPMDIAFGNINFSPVPEVNPAAAAAAVCAIPVVVAWRRRRLLRQAT